MSIYSQNRVNTTTNEDIIYHNDYDEIAFQMEINLLDLSDDELFQEASVNIEKLGSCTITVYAREGKNEPHIHIVLLVLYVLLDFLL